MSQTTVLIFPFLEISKEISLYVSKEKNGSLFNIFSKAEKSDVLCLTEIKDVLPQAEYHIPLTEHNVEDMHTENTQEGTLRNINSCLLCKVKLSVFVFLTFS